MDKNKKSDLSINMIVIAAIALGVLVVTFVILTRQSSTTTRNLEGCELKGGKCAKDLPSNTNAQKLSCNHEVYNVPVLVDDPACGESKLCCLKIG